MTDKWTDKWTEEDMKASSAKGWFLVSVWDPANKRLEYEISAVSKGPFKSDEEARAFVLAMIKSGDKLAEKAVRIVFISKVKGAPK